MVHGKSEKIICESIKSNLKIKQEIISNNNGKSSIQVNSIMKQWLNKDKRFKSINNFCRYFDSIEYNKKEKRIKNFKFFIIMDLDDCGNNDPKEKERVKNAFINKELFKGHWLYEYIFPIYNDPTLEKVVEKAGIVHKKIKKKNKAQSYIKLFPTNNGDIDIDKAKDLINKLKGQKNTNLEEYIQYCINIAETNAKLMHN